MSLRTSTQRPAWMKRAISLLLTAVMVVGLLPAAAPRASAHWADAYLDQLVDWGVLRADQTANPDAPLTRAEFMAVINRAYGYTETGAIPFTDVVPTDWFYDDVSIAYTAGYMAGTSETTASPNDTLTREQAVCILGRNMMLEETPGESLAFSDSRDVSSWARGTLKTAVDNYIVSGYPDNSFHPLAAISKAQMAVLVTQCVGTPVSQSGTYSLGGVFGNVTITAPNVTLRDTTISGDLYISGGVGLGGIKLENVNVLGRIIVSGTGESEAGDASVVMRNVNAKAMLVDNMRNKTVTIRADGITEIADTVVRTTAYLEDNNTDDKGLLNISLEGEPGTRLTLAGRIKEVVNKSPDSTVQVAKGSVKKLTVDESATNSTVQIDRNAKVEELNLDVATNVIGEGDIGKLNINAPGSVVTMLPDEIYIRPGLDASIGGIIMDHTDAEEGSTDPRLLSGYPAAKDIAPTGFRADFSGNKKGTIFWAVSSISDGSIGEEALISPPTYGSKAIQGGSVAAPTGGTVVNAQVTGLTVAGSYYLSALLRDEQGRTSPVKVVSFTTPDNSVPAFAQGYPYMSMITDTEAQVTVMPTKTCKMYYAVLPRSAQAPTVNDMKSNAVTNNLGYGIVDLEKNKEEPFMVSRRLEELKDYTLYLWLTDVDGVNSSEIISLQFTTMDVTPPVFVTGPDVNEFLANSVRLSASINEAGTIYWAVVESGTDYPKPNNQDTDQNTEDQKRAKLDSDFAKLQVANGMNCLQKGQVTVQANAQATINVTGLQPEKAYDFYYLAKDNAGPNRNYSETVKMITIYTLDKEPPVVNQYFSDYSGRDNTQNPLPSTDIILEFSEAVRSNATTESKSWVDLYNAIVPGNNPLAGVLNASITMYQDTGSGRPQPVKTKYLREDQSSDWVIDLTEAKVEMKDGKMLLTFPKDGLQMASGGTYYFQLNSITDTSNGQNPMVPGTVDYTNMADGGHNIPKFTTVFAQVNLSNPGVGASDAPIRTQANSNGNKDVATFVDLSFRMSPQATEKVDLRNSYDIYLWSDTIVKYDLYYRIVRIESDGYTVTPVTSTVDKKYLLDSRYSDIDSKGWVYLGNSGEVNPNPENGNLAGKAVNRHFNKLESNKFPPLNRLSENYSYEFSIELTEMVGSENRGTWNGQISFDVYVAAGLSNSLYTLGTGLTMDLWEQYKELGLTNSGIASIGLSPQDTEYLRIRQLFTDTQLPEFATSKPEFLDDNIGDTFATINLGLDRAGKIYYVIAPVGEITTTIEKNGKTYNNQLAWPEVDGNDGEGGGNPPQGGTPEDMGYKVITPTKLSIYRRTEYAGNSKIHTGVIDYPGGGSNFELTLNEANKTPLQPEKEYFAYFVVQGAAQEYSEVYCYRFKTTNVNKPQIMLHDVGAGHVNVNTQNVPGDLDYAIWTSYNISSNNVLKWKLESNKATGVTIPEFYQKYSVIGSDGTETKVDMTILQAILTTYDHSQAGNDGDVKLDGYSVFDVYASDSVKALVRDLIQSRNQNSPSGGGNDFMTEKNTPVDITATNIAAGELIPNTPYTILVTGRHPSSSDITSSYTFKGRDNIVIPDQAAPKAIGAGGSIEHNTSTNKFNGIVTIRFDKELYWVADRLSTTALPVHQGCGDTDKNKNCIDIVDYVTKSGVTVTATDEVKYVTTSISLTYSNMSEGQEFSFVSKGSLSNSDRIPMEGSIVCRLAKIGETTGASGMVTRSYQLQVIKVDAQGREEIIGRSATLEIKSTTRLGG